MKSYTMALEMAIGNKQRGFAVAALHSHASLPPFPPCITHFDQHRDPNSECNPVAELVNSFARAQIHAQKFGDDEHQLQRDELFQQIQCATQQLQDITPNLHGINSLHVTQVVSNHGGFHEGVDLMGGLRRMAAGGRQTCHCTVQ